MSIHNLYKHIDIALFFCYHIHMSNQLIELSQIQRIMGISYPTALKRAQAQGVFVNTPPKGKWYFRAADIRQQLQDEIDRAENQLSQIDKLLENGAAISS